ncbi:helix-turn-helix domain-containing protein [Halomonas elongata]|uniref:helix-turn-helix domain-containing protein n=1 Tax=Halomonas elongata TaxID=2746 RepID=UPI0038D466A4
MDRLLTPDQVAEQLGMSQSWVYANKHRIGYHQIGTAIRFEPGDVAAYAKRCRCGPQIGEDRLWDTPSRKGRTVTRGSSAQRSTVTELSALFAQKEKQSSTH